MNLKNTMKNIHNFNYGGSRKLRKTRESIFKLLKEYLQQKNNKKVVFFDNADELICDMLEDEQFYPKSVIVLDNEGYAASSFIYSIQLTAEGKIRIDTDEAGTILDAEKYLHIDDLFKICDTLEQFEKAMQNIREALVDNGEWKQHALNLLFRQTNRNLSEITEYVSNVWKPLEPDDNNIMEFLALHKPAKEIYAKPIKI